MTKISLCMCMSTSQHLLDIKLFQKLGKDLTRNNNIFQHIPGEVATDHKCLRSKNILQELLVDYDPHTLKQEQ